MKDERRRRWESEELFEELEQEKGYIAGGRCVPCSPGLYTARLGSGREGGRVSAWGGVHWGPVLVPCGFEELGDLTNISAGPEATPGNGPHVEMTGCVLIAEMG